MTYFNLDAFMPMIDGHIVFIIYMLTYEKVKNVCYYKFMLHREDVTV